jgi:phage terminase large subunit-like protein
MVAYVVDVLREQVSVPQFARDLRAFQARNWNAPVRVEAVGGFKAVPQLLREVDPNIRLEEIHPVGDKFQRAQGVAAAWNQGRVLVPMNAP